MKGLRQAVLTDVAVAYKVALSIPLLAIALVQHQWIDLSVLLVVTAVVLMGEIFNTAIEALCDVVQPDHSEAIAAIKDMAAAAVALGILAWIGVLIIEGLRIL